MKISKEYGPQFDPEDGTIGELQLVKRWYTPHQPRQGRFTYATEAEAQAKTPPDCATAELWWCYPNHFDPAHPCKD